MSRHRNRRFGLLTRLSDHVLFCNQITNVRENVTPCDASILWLRLKWMSEWTTTIVILTLKKKDKNNSGRQMSPIHTITHTYSSTMSTISARHSNTSLRAMMLGCVSACSSSTSRSTALLSMPRRLHALLRVLMNFPAHWAPVDRSVTCRTCPKCPLCGVQAEGISYGYCTRNTCVHRYKRMCPCMSDCGVVGEREGNSIYVMCDTMIK